MGVGGDDVSGTGPGGYRPEFAAALDLLAQAMTILRDRGAPLPVLVGGAVVEFDTRSAVSTGDFDPLGGDEPATAEALEQVGFVREGRQGWKLGRFHHPRLGIGVEFVSGAYFDARGDRARIPLVARPQGEVPITAVEDLIADRLGQWEASRRRDMAMLRQARLLHALTDELDRDYLARRIAEETSGGCGPDILVEDSP